MWRIDGRAGGTMIVADDRTPHVFTSDDVCRLEVIVSHRLPLVIATSMATSSLPLPRAFEVLPPSPLAVAAVAVTAGLLSPVSPSPSTTSATAPSWLHT